MIISLVLLMPLESYPLRYISCLLQRRKKLLQGWWYVMISSRSCDGYIAISIRTTCCHMFMHGCGAEGANNHFGKGVLTCATNMAKTKFGPPERREKTRSVEEIANHRFQMKSVKTTIAWRFVKIVMKPKHAQTQRPLRGAVYRSIYQPGFLDICLIVYLSIYPSICLSIRLSILSV